MMRESAVANLTNPALNSVLCYRLVFIHFSHFTFNLLHFICLLCVGKTYSFASFGRAVGFSSDLAIPTKNRDKLCMALAWAYSFVNSFAINSACFNTVSVASFCISGGYPNCLKVRFIITFNFALTLSFIVQSIDAFAFTLSVKITASSLNLSFCINSFALSLSETAV